MKIMGISIKQLSFRHTRIGYRNLLIYLDIALLIFVLGEIGWFLWTGGSLKASFFLFFSLGIPLDTAISILAGVAFLAIVLPNLLSSLSILLKWPEPFAASRKFFFFTHSFFVLAIVLYLAFTHSMSITSGRYIRGNETSFVFSSILASWAVRWIAVVSTILAGLFALIAKFVLEKKTPPLFEGYTKELLLSDFSGDFYPKKQHFVNLNAGALAPEIPFIRTYASQLKTEYQNTEPKEKKIELLLKRHLSDNTILLFNIFFDGTLQPADMVVEYFSSTSRALEVAVSQSRCKYVFLSPYEHSSELNVLSWIKATNDLVFYPCVFNADDLRQEFGFQKTKLVHDVKKFFDGVQETGSKSGELDPDSFIIETEGKIPIAILISEVWSGGGWHLPIGEIVSALIDAIGRENLIIIVDGAHAMGNVPITFDYDFDYYVTSAHKWLLSPEPGGIMFKKVSAKHFPSYDSIKHDAFSMSTMSINQIVGLRAGLEAINRLTFSKIHLRCLNNKQILMERLRKNFDFLNRKGLSEGTAILAIRPNENMQWEGKYYPQGLERKLQDKGLIAVPFSLDTTEIERTNPWVRLTVPYFLTRRDIDRASDILNELVSEAKCRQ